VLLLPSVNTGGFWKYSQIYGKFIKVPDFTSAFYRLIQGIYLEKRALASGLVFAPDILG
jgi:hypothetical protein